MPLIKLNSNYIINTDRIDYVYKESDSKIRVYMAGESVNMPLNMTMDNFLKLVNGEQRGL